MNKEKRYIKSIFCIDYPGPGELPPDPYNAYGDVRVDIGYENEVGVSNYAFDVYTPTKLDSSIKGRDQKCLFGRHMLIVEKFDYDIIEKAIETIIDEIEEYGHDVT